MTRHRLTAVVAALFSVGALSTASLLPTADAARPAERAAAIPFTAVSVDASNHVTLPATLRPGLRTVKISTTATSAREAGFVHLKAGYTLDELVADLDASFASQQPDLVALNRLYDSSVFSGGGVARVGKPGLFRITFAAGQWYAFNPHFPITTDSFTPFMVTGEPTGATTKYTARITADHDHFWDRTPASIPSSGWLKFRNNAESPHFLELAHLAPGKTYADFKAWIKAVKSGHNAPPPFGKFSLDVFVVTQGHSFLFKYDIPKGDYVVLCFMPDRKTGMPHAFMGMHRPLTVK